MRVYSGAFGGPFRRLGTYSRDGGGLGEIVIATSPGGRTLVAWAGAYPHWLSAQRSSDGNLGPIEDVAPGCESMSTPDLSVDDGGHTLAFWGGYYESPETRLARGDEGPGHQGCAPESHYQSASMNPAPRGGPGGGSWELPLLPNAPEHVLAGLDVQTPTIAGEGATRRVSVRAKCGEECYGFGSLGIVGPKGRLLYRVRLGGAGSGAGNRLSFEQGFTMKPALRRKLAGRPLKAVLRLKFGDAWNRRVSRHFKVQGADVTD
jgi:hypothetical protein